MKHAVLAVAAVASLCTPAFAQDRLTDPDVKALVARIEDARDKFDDALDSDLKNKVLRGPNGEVNVKNFLDDFQKNIDRLEERLKPDYGIGTISPVTVPFTTERRERWSPPRRDEC